MRVQELIDSQERFTRCWTLAQPAVASYIAAVVPDFHATEDLLQNVAVACLRKFAQYDERRPFVAWALGMAKIELLRTRRAQARLPILWDDTLLEDLAGVCEELEPEMQVREWALGECLRELKGRSLDLVRLRYQEALKPSAIAERLGLGGVAVRVALNRVRAALRQCIERRIQSSERTV